MRLRAFVEAGPTGAMVRAGEFLFVATHDGLDRIHLASGEHLIFGVAQGLPGSVVYSMAHDPAAPALWVAGDGGIARFEPGSSAFRRLPEAPEVFRLGSLEESVLAAARDGGLWIGNPAGLFYISGDGSWSQTGIATPVSALEVDGAGTLWIAAEEGLLWVGADRGARDFDADDGCGFERLVDLSPFQERGVLLLAEDALGHRVLALARDQGCTQYLLPDDSPWSALIGGAGAAYLVGGTSVFALANGEASEGLAPKSLLLRAAAVRGDAPASLQLEEVLSSAPTQATELVAGDRELFVGTESRGVLRVTREGQTSWIQRGELAGDAHELSVACVDENDCFLALGNHRLWHWDGAVFVDEGQDQGRNHFVMSLADGRRLLLRDADEPGRAEFFLREGAAWQKVDSVVLQTPGERMQVRSVRQAPDGLIWVSLGYFDGPGDAASYGVAAVDLELGTVWYHRASFDEEATSRGILPVPVNVTGIGFLGDDEIWLASSQGASRVVGDKIQKFTETDGLLSEILSAVVCSSGGMVYTASGRGVGQWDGRKWSFPASLRTTVHDLAIALDGSLWLATDRGIGIHDGAYTRRLDERRGLLENRVLDLEVDTVGRVWARSELGLMLITP